MKDLSLVDITAHRRAEEVGTLYNTVGEVEAELLVNKVAPKVQIS